MYLFFCFEAIQASVKSFSFNYLAIQKYQNRIKSYYQKKKLNKGVIFIEENKNSNIVEYKSENIKNLIYTIRGKQVMLDSDVAMLYHYETKKVNQAVKRNIDRFPERFCFQLTEEELEIMWSQIVTTSKLEDNK